MAAITTRATAGTGATVKNSPLTNAELDNNFINLNTDLSNAVYTTGSYSDPSWITSLSETKVLPNQTDNTGKYLTTDGINSSWAAVTLPSGQTAGNGTAGYLQYAGTTKTAGQFDGGTTAPTNTTRLNYDGYLYATRFYGDGSTITGVSASNIPGGMSGGIPYKQITGTERYSVYFDGEGDKLIVSNTAQYAIFDDADFTIEFWVKLDSLPTTNPYYVVDTYDTDINFGFTVSINSSGTVSFVMGGGTPITLNTPSAVVTTNTWYHIAIVRLSTTTYRIFVNGTQQLNTTNTNSFYNSFNTLNVGNSVIGGNALHGTISNLRIIKAYPEYSSNFTPPSLPLTATSFTSLLICRYADFFDGSTGSATVTPYYNATVVALNPDGASEATESIKFSNTQTADTYLKFNGTIPVWESLSIVANSSSYNTVLGYSTTVGYGSTIIGREAISEQYSTVVGNYAKAGYGGITIGTNSGSSITPATEAVNIGYAVGQYSGIGSVNIGSRNGGESGNEQGNYTVSIGYWAGITAQGDNSIAIGRLAGYGADSLAGVSLGYGGSIVDTQGTIDTGGYLWDFDVGSKITITGTNTGTSSISGYVSGNTYYVIAKPTVTRIQISTTKGGTPVTTVAGTISGSLTITGAGNVQAARTIILNATGTVLEGISGQTDSTYIAPVRQDNSTKILAYYNSSTNELTYSPSLRENRVAVAASDINVSSGNYFTKTISGATTFTVSNVPASGTAASFILDLTNGGSATINWWTGTKWAGGIAPTLTASGRDVLGFFTHDGGTTWSGLVLGKDVK